VRREVVLDSLETATSLDRLDELAVQRAVNQHMRIDGGISSAAPPHQVEDLARPDPERRRSQRPAGANDFRYGVGIKLRPGGWFEPIPGRVFLRDRMIEYSDARPGGSS